MKKKTRTVNDLLEDVEIDATKNMVADNEPLADAILQFLQLKATGHPKASHLTLRWFYLNKLRPEFGGPKWYGTVLKYARDVLHLNPQTGNPL